MAHNQFPLNLNDFWSYTDADKILSNVSHRDVAVRTNRRTSLHALYKGLSNVKKGLSYSPWTF